jgi:hypothetical protein
MIEKGSCDKVIETYMKVIMEEVMKIEVNNDRNRHEVNNGSSDGDDVMDADMWVVMDTLMVTM